ncbi:Choline-sulfatase [Pirellula sp. SH-Sr6A]|uniref:sulfatase n=1 Tax=Pirellula sp. SH-Sr6A TaxID=1632865 RepID=UPI00078D09FF|nr:Choline-sulfatase [Pirellula sp. SH-Sr6A]
MHRLPLSLGMLLLLVCCPIAPAADSRPNVLFIISDDLNNMLGCYGDPLAKTPNIDRLAARGVRFDRAYCTFPLCGPSRNSMLTGLYPNSTGILANAQIFRQTIPTHRSLPQAFRNAGYFVTRIGKLYHYNVPRSIGTNGHDDPGSWEMEINPAGVDRLVEEPQIYSLTPGQFGGTLSWFASPEPDAKHTDGLMASDAEWVLERCSKQNDRPFFLALGFFRPHTPYVAPKTYFSKYPRESMPVVQGIDEDQKDIPAPGLGSYKREQDKLTDELRQEARQAYLASISFMDSQVGRVVDTLDRLKLSENTIIVFTSDHGYHMGEHGLWQKMSLFEESARVPLLIVTPNSKQAGQVAKTPVSHVDLYPTLAELCQVPTQDALQGESLVPILNAPETKGRGWALTQVMRGGGQAAAAVTTNVGADGKRFFGYSLRTDRYRYTEWAEGERGRELYDHDKDPHEIRNLANESDFASIRDELSKQLQAAVKTTYPPSGETPSLKPGLWAPDLTNP